MEEEEEDVMASVEGVQGKERRNEDHEAEKALQTEPKVMLTSAETEDPCDITTRSGEGVLVRHHPA